MITDSLMVVTMAIAFYVIPVILLGGAALFMWRWRALDKARRGPRTRQRIDVVSILKDPVLVAAALAISGFAMVAFLTGSLSPAHYVRVPADAARVLSHALTRWKDPLSSASIALRGGVLIGLASVIVVVASLRSYFRSRLAAAGNEAAAAGGAPGNQ